MTTISHSTARLGAALIAAIAAVAIAAPVSGASLISRPPKSGAHMHWYHSHSTKPISEFGSTAVVGLESMDDLQALGTEYGFTHVRAIPGLHAAEVKIGRRQLRALLASKDSRIRYVSPLGKSRVQGAPEIGRAHV